MSLHRHGAHRVSPPRPRLAAVTLVALLAAAIVPVPGSGPPSVAAAGDYLLMTRSELLARPTSGSAWAELKETADMSLGTPDLCDQEARHHMRTLAAALVYARTGNATYGTKARGGVMAAIKTQVAGCDNATLALGRQLLAYVLAADFSDLSGTSESTFRTWLSAIRTKKIGGHSKWYSLRVTHEESAANWGAHAGASRIAASLYLGDTTDVSTAARVTRGFLGDRGAYAGFGHVLDSTDLSWACSATSYTPTNPSCTKSGINVDGAFITDISRGGSLRWPPGETGVNYQLESIQGMGMQVELLSRNGYPEAWKWSSGALKRAAGVVTRSAASGGTGWNLTTASRQMPWLLNLRYGTSIPTRVNGPGRIIGFTSWLYGAGASTTPTPSAPSVRLTAFRTEPTNTASISGVNTLVAWKAGSTGSGLARYELELQRDGGSWTRISLADRKATRAWVTLAPGRVYAARVRLVDTSGKASPWATAKPRLASRLDDGASAIRYGSSWSTASHSEYIGGRVHTTGTKDARVEVAFQGTSIAWVSPVGPTRGKARVYLDGTYVRVVDLYASAFRPRRVVFAMSVPDGRHTLTIKAVGTAGRPQVGVDAFFALDPR
jgi:hypothetical protein